MPELTAVDRSFAATALRFELNVGAIRDFVESLEPAATLPRKEGFARFTEQITELLRTSTRPAPDTARVTPELASEGLRSLADNLHLKFVHGAQRDQVDPEQYVVDGNIAFQRDAAQRLMDTREIEILVLIPDEMESSLQEATRKFAQGADRTRLLYGSALISLFTMFETLVSELVDKFYELNRSALAAGGNTVDVKDVVQADSLEELVRDLTARRTDQVVRGGFDEWSKFFDRNYKTNLIELLAASRWSIPEAIQRRHVLVHNNGFVDQAYLQKVDPTCLDHLAAKPAYGKQLSADRDYLDRIIGLWVPTGRALLDEARAK